MRRLIYSMNATLDGYLAARGKVIGWSVPRPSFSGISGARASGIRMG